MRTKIDWISFTVPVRRGVESGEGFAVNVENGFFDLLGKDTVEQVFGGKWGERENGRAPYSNSYDIEKSGAVAFLNPKMDTVLVEFSGSACDKLRELGFERTLLETVKNRVTRLDLACDMETDVQPDKFAPKAKYASTTSYSEINSRTGNTVYIGSRNSERYTRVYRYAPPHPRSGLLRVEFVFRREVARAVTYKILEHGEGQVASFYGDKANFLHESWQPANLEISFDTFVRAEREAGKTVYWMVKQVAPSFRRLVREGVITDPEQFLQRYFLNIPQV